MKAGVLCITTTTWNFDFL